MNGHRRRDALVEALAGQLGHHARALRIDVAEQIRAAFRGAGFTGPYLDAGHLVGQLPPGVGGLPPDAVAALDDDLGVGLVDDAGVALTVAGAYAAANHTHPGGGGGGLDIATADGRYVQFLGGSVMTGSLSPEDDFGTDLGTPSRRFDTVRAAYGRLARDLGLEPPTIGSGDVATVRVGSEGFDRLTVGTDGLLRWGPGTADRDVSLGRSGAGALGVTGALGVSGALTAGGKTVAADPLAGNALLWNAAGFYVPTSVPTTLVDAKGDLIAGSAADAVARLAVGADGTVLTADATAATGLAWAAPAATASLLVNGGFEVHQRGGTVTATNAYAHDRWQLVLGGTSTATVTNETAVVDDGSGAALKCVYVHNAASRIDQKLEGYAQLRGRTVSFRIRVRQGAAGSARAYVEDSGTRTYAATQATTGAYLTFAVTLAIGAAATAVRVGVELGASDTVYLDNASLVVGSVAVPYAPLHPFEDLGRCQRYYRELGGLDTDDWVCIMQVYATTNAMGVLLLPVEMALAPTVTVSSAGDWGVLNAAGSTLACTALVGQQITRRSLRLTATVASGLVAGNASFLVSRSTLAARIRLEANP